MFEAVAASARAAPLIQESVREGLHISCMIPNSPSTLYHSDQIIFGIQTKLALIVDTNFLIEVNGRNNGVRREDNVQLG